jgi:hypothetical protein
MRALLRSLGVGWMRFGGLMAVDADQPAATLHLRQHVQGRRELRLGGNSYGHLAWP